MASVIYINIPFFGSSQTQSQVNTEEIALYFLENLYQSDLMNAQIYYNYIGPGCDGIREDNFDEILKQRPYYSTMTLLGTYPETNEKDTSIIMTFMYEHMIEHYSCYWNVLFINLYEIISIYPLSSIYESFAPQIPQIPKTHPPMYDLNDPYNPLYNLTKKYNILSTISSVLTREIPTNTPFEKRPITNMSILQKNWMDYLIYFYITNQSTLIAELRTSNVVGIDLQRTPNLQYYANIWWSTSNYLHSLIYINNVCTESVFNGLIGGLYRSVWNSKINWRTDGMANGNNYDTIKTAVSPENLINTRKINGDEYVFYDLLLFTDPSRSPYYYEIITDENNGQSRLEIEDVSLKKGYFFTTNQCFVPIVKNKIKKQQNRLLFGFSNDIQYGEPLLNSNNLKEIKKTKETKETKEKKTQQLNLNGMTRKQMSYIHPEISACEYRKRLLIWNKPKPTPSEPPADTTEKTRSLVNENPFIFTVQPEPQNQRIKMKMLF